MADAIASRPYGSRLPAVVLGIVVTLYLGIVMIAPLTGLVVEAVTTATGEAATTIDTVALGEAFGRSLLLALIAAVANGAIGVGAGIVIARHRFLGRGVLDALTDIPLAVSPVMIGLAFLTGAVLASRLIEAMVHPAGMAELFRESLLIGGWVAMWRPLEIFLYDWWPIRAESRLYDRLGAMPVALRTSDRANP